MNLTNKNIVYVGGTGGIGVETCKQLMLRNIGYLVVLDKFENKEALNAIKRVNTKIPVLFWSYDLRMKVEYMKKIFAQIVSKVGKIDILINGAGILNDREIELTIQINLIGGINTVVAAFEQMDKRSGGPGGVIVNIASVAGLNGFATVPVYSATKAGVVTFSTSIAQLEALTGITVFTVCPGITRTPILHTMNTFLGIDDSLASTIAKIAVQTPEECAKNFVSAIEVCKNGAIWILDNKKKTNVEIPTYWNPPKELLEK